MATDVIANLDTKFLTVVSDADLGAITSVALVGDRLVGRLAGGLETEFGKLADSMLLEAKGCESCLISHMGTDRVVSSRRVAFFNE